MSSLLKVLFSNPAALAHNVWLNEVLTIKNKGMSEGINSMVKTIQQLEKENAELKLRLGGVMHRYSNEELEEMCEELVYQMTGVEVPEGERCQRQGDPYWQIGMYYLTKINNGA